MSWMIALPEYALAVPANRIGPISNSGSFTAPQLKILQEGIALTVFLVFSSLYLKEVPRWTDFAGMGLIMAGLAVALLGKTAYLAHTPDAPSARQTSSSVGLYCVGFRKSMAFITIVVH